MPSSVLDFIDFIIPSVIFVSVFSVCFYKLTLFFRKVLKLEASYKEVLTSIVHAVFFLATGFWVLCVIFMDFFANILFPFSDMQEYTTHHKLHILQFCAGAIVSIYVLFIFAYVVLYFKKNSRIKNKT